MVSNGGKIEVSICVVEDLTDNLIEKIKEYYSLEFVSPDIEVKIDTYTGIFKEGLFCLIEFPYVDKVYRDSYYNYFSSKHQKYFRDCIRVSLFSDEINFDDFLSSERRIFLQEHYLGYFIVRPTFPSVFGRAVLCKSALEQNDFLTLYYTDNSLINGVKLEIKGFPHSSQDRESISCAETTIWSLMEYFGNRYAEYKPILPSETVKSLSNYTEQRMIPTRGLSVDEISFALKEFGFGTRIYDSESFKEDFNKIIGYYVESGIPMITALNNSIVAHAILIIGRENIDLSAVNYDDIELTEINDELKFYDFSDFEKRYLVNDDNDPPYKLISLDNPVEEYSDERFHGCILDSIVVPFYPKIYLEAIKAKELVIGILKEDDFGFKFDDNFVLRFFLASSRSFKNHISQLDNLDNEVRKLIILSNMPKFIWCAEFYTKEGLKEEKALGFMLIDATEASDISLDSLILAIYPEKVITLLGNNFVSLQLNTENYHLFRNNLI